MMILNENYLKDELNKKTFFYQSENWQERRKYDSKKKYDLFISHSFMDKELVEVLYKKFEEAGYTVYIDWKEKALQNRDNVSDITAILLKHRMNNCTGLAYIATSNVVKSKWCPWELGYADGKKNKALVLPIMEEKMYHYNGMEYLGIYPYIDYQEGRNGKFDFWVNDSKERNKYTTLRNWLNNGELIKH